MQIPSESQRCVCVWSHADPSKSCVPDSMRETQSDARYARTKWQAQINHHEEGRVRTRGLWVPSGAPAHLRTLSNRISSAQQQDFCHRFRWQRPVAWSGRSALADLARSESLARAGSSLGPSRRQTANLPVTRSVPGTLRVCLSARSDGGAQPGHQASGTVQLRRHACA
jgi:hypothetical protein